jgi:hypothetical protein
MNKRSYFGVFIDDRHGQTFTMTEIQIGNFGKILAGDHRGQFVKVVYDPNETGGDFIHVGDDNKHLGWDSWVENLEHVTQYFEEAGWQIDWED